MINFGKTCKQCLCSRCENWNNCEITGIVRREYCEQGCNGENGATSLCSIFKENLYEQINTDL